MMGTIETKLIITFVNLLKTNRLSHCNVLNISLYVLYGTLISFCVCFRLINRGEELEVQTFAFSVLHDPSFPGDKKE